MPDKPTYSNENLPAIRKLLDELCTRAEIESMLRKANAPFSAAKKLDVINTRVVEALDKRQIEIGQLVDLLRDAEEHGRQHVYLFACSKAKAAEVLDEDRVRNALKEIGAKNALDKPRVLDVPDKATITEVRLERFPKGQPKALIIKQVERREKLLAPIKGREGNHIVTRYPVVYTRGVNVVRLHHDGLLEIRLEAERQAEYDVRRGALRKLLSPILTEKDFHPVRLDKAKTYMWENREKLKSEVRIWWAKARTPNGDSATFATSEPGAHLCDRPGHAKGLAAFMDESDRARGRMDRFVQNA